MGTSNHDCCGHLICVTISPLVLRPSILGTVTTLVVTTLCNNKPACFAAKNMGKSNHDCCGHLICVTISPLVLRPSILGTVTTLVVTTLFV